MKGMEKTMVRQVLKKQRGHESGAGRTAKEPKVDGRLLRSVDTRDLILDAALELFAARGVTSTSVDDIAEKAGIAKGSIYYNFGSKAKVVHALLSRHAMRLTAALAGAATHPGAKGRREILGTLLAVMHEHPDVARVIVSEMFRTDREWLDIVREWQSTITDALENNLLAEIPPAQREQSRTRCAMQAAALLGAALTAGLYWLVFDPDEKLDSVLDAITTISWKD